MKNLLAPSNRAILEAMAGANPLLAFDFDGTLAPIVTAPDDAQMRSTTRTLLGRLADRYSVVVLSGRALGDVAARLSNVALAEVVGNHGIEPSADTSRCERIVRDWLPAIVSAVAGLSGTEVEDKRFSIAVHYRRCQRKAEAIATVQKTAASFVNPARILGGKQVLNLLPEGAPNKGMALSRLIATLGRDTALYVGDDATDEDVFAMARPGSLLCVRVGRARQSLAGYFLRDQVAVDDLLQRLVELGDTLGIRRW
jgi:trehalose 6-phosphate phosphatase